jgi:pSer/pThr/pTyr-binding forkhead associated (FHA) protein
VRIEHPSVSPRHLQLRREETAFVLRMLKGSGPAFVNDTPLTKAHPLRDGERIRLGDVVLTFSEPRRRDTATSPWLRKVETLELPDPVVQQLIAMNDPRVVLTLIERLSPDLCEAAHARQTLSALYGPDAERVMAARAAFLATRAATSAQLAALTGQDPHTASAGIGPWLVWWSQARLHWPTQITTQEPARALTLRSLSGSAQPPSVDLSPHGVVLLGSDERCTVRVNDPLASRHHVTIAGLHRRLSVSDAQSRAGTSLNGQPLHAAFFEAGDRLGLGAAEWTLDAGEVARPREVAPGVYEIDPLSVFALEGLGHPSVAAALVGFLREDLSWLDATAAQLFGEDRARRDPFCAQLQATYATRKRDALRRLPTILGADAGADPAAWSQLLASRRPSLPPQVVPAGWLRV